jgi:hypothetical protein
MTKLHRHLRENSLLIALGFLSAPAPRVTVTNAVMQRAAASSAH